jgi:hypothetical protein
VLGMGWGLQSDAKLHGYGYGIVPDTSTSTGTGMHYFLKTYVGYNGYWISGTIRVRVSSMIRVRVRELKWSTRAN